MILKQITPPTAEPITAAEACAQMRIDPAYLVDDPAVIDGYIVSARQKAETYLRRALMTQTWELVFDAFPAVIKVPLPPLQSVSSIKYIDVNGAEQTLDPALYKVDSDSEPARIVPAYGQSWPATRNEINAVRVRFVAGFGVKDDQGEVDPLDPAAVPQCVKQWLLLNVANMYENRESVMVGLKAQAVEIPTLADGLLDACPGGRAFEF